MPLCPDADTRLKRRRVAATSKCSCCVCMCVGGNEWVLGKDSVTHTEGAEWETAKDKACMTNSFMTFVVAEFFWRLPQRAAFVLGVVVYVSADTFYKFAWQMVIWVWADLMGFMLHFSVTRGLTDALTHCSHEQASLSSLQRPAVWTHKEVYRLVGCWDVWPCNDHWWHTHTCQLMVNTSMQAWAHVDVNFTDKLIVGICKTLR